MPTYVNTIIYKIYCKDETIENCYVGHTTNFKSRINEHKYACNNDKSKSHNMKLYSTIRENGGWNNWIIEKIEDYPCDTKEQAKVREHYYYFILKANLNTISPILDEEKIKRYSEKKSQEAKELTKIKLQKKKEDRLQYLEEHKDEILQHQQEVRKEYCKRNREIINEKMKEYRSKNKEKISEIAKKAYEKRKKNGYYIKLD